MENSVLEKKIKSFFSSLEDDLKEEFLLLLNNVSDLSKLSNCLQSLDKSSQNKEKEKKLNFSQHELQSLENIFCDKNHFKSNRFLVDFIKYHFRAIIGQTNLEKRSRKEIAKKFYTIFRKKFPEASFSMLKEKIFSALSQNDYEDLFSALINK
jgi:hypothetical protein